MKENIYKNIPTNLINESFDELLSNKNIKIERIISKGHTTKWYNQNESEWVLLLKGEAILEFEDKELRLKEGDYVDIPAFVKHRVAWTDSSCETIWLAIFYSEENR